MSVKHNVVHSWQMLNSADSSLREQLWFWIKYLTNKFGTFITLMSRSECLQTYSLQCLQYNDVMILTHSRLPASVQASELLSVISVPLTPCWDWSSDPDITRVTLSLSPLSLSFPCVSSLHLLFSFLKGLSGFMKAVYEKNKERQRGKTRQYQTYPHGWCSLPQGQSWWICLRHWWVIVQPGGEGDSVIYTVLSWIKSSSPENMVHSVHK